MPHQPYKGEKTKFTYTVNVKCVNCDYGSFGGEEIEIKMGNKVDNEICPRCGCETIIKN